MRARAERRRAVRPRLLDAACAVPGPRAATSLAAAATAVVALIGAPSPAHAAAPILALQVAGSQAPYFVLAARPGASTRGEVAVIDTGPVGGGLSLYAVDAATGQTSGAVYRSPQEPRRDVGAWITLTRHHLTLGPGQETTVGFAVTVPPGARPGQHLGGIVATPDQSRARLSSRRGNASFHIRVLELTVIAVEVNLPGPRTQQLTITGVRPGNQPAYQTLLVGLASTGNALTHGTGTLTITDGHGRQRLARSFPLDTFVPATAIDYPIQVTGRALPAGQYRATVTIRYAGREQTRVLPLTITGRSLTESFGSRRTAPPAGGGPSLIPYVVAALALALVAFALGARLRPRVPPAKP